MRPETRKLYQDLQKAIDAGEFNLPPVGKKFTFGGKRLRRLPDYLINGKANPNWVLVKK